MKLRTKVLTVAVGLLLATPAAAQINLTGQDQGGDHDDEGPPPGAPRVPWRGTAAKWTQSVTTSALGVGSDYQSDSGQVYSHGYNLLLNYYLLQKPEGSLRVATSPGFDVEVTNSSSTTLQREPQLRDLNLTAVGSIPVVQDAPTGQAVILIPNTTVFLPTSEISRKTGTYFVTSPRLTAAYAAPFLKGVDFPSNVTVGAQGRWDHQFNAATEPVSNALGERFTRTNLNMSQMPADNLSGSPNAHDVVSGAGFLALGGSLAGQPLALSLAFVYSQSYLYTFSEACVQQTDGTCIDVVGAEQASGLEPGTTRTSTAFSVSVQYSVIPEVTLSVGYVNSANRIGPDGLERSPFYSPGAAFTTEVGISLDAIYEAVTGPRRTTAFYLPG